MTALRIFSSVAALVFVVFAGAALVMHARPETKATFAMFAVSAVICGVISRMADSVTDDGCAEVLLTVLCLVPLANVLTGIALLNDITVTNFLTLTFLIFGVLAMRWQMLAALLAGGFGLWALECLWLGFGHDDIAHYAYQLALRAVLAAVVFRIRLRLDAQGQATAEELDRQIDALAETRLQHGRDLTRYRAMFSDGPIGILLMDVSGTVVDANQAMLDLLRRPVEHVVGRDAGEFVHADDRADRTQADDTARAVVSGARFDLSRRLVRGDGEIRTTSVSVSPVTGPDGEAWMLAYFQDDTERNRLEDEVRRSRDGMRAVADIATAAQRGVDPRVAALGHLQRLVDAQHVMVIEARDDETLVMTASLRPELLGVTIPLSERTASTHVWRTGEAMFIADTQASPIISPRLLELVGSATLMWQPVGLPTDLQAVLVIGWERTVNDLDHRDRDTIRTIAVELSTAMQAEGMRLQLERRSRVDALTGLLNRRGWEHELARLVDEARSQGRPTVLAVADLDHFKQFNDEFGHLEGDILLSGFGANAKKAVRDKDVLARWGGEEFAIALGDCDMVDATPVLDRIRASVPAGRTCSIGFATLHPDETVTECMKRVDLALYRAKAAGRNRLEYSRYDVPAPTITEGPAQDVVSGP